MDNNSKLSDIKSIITALDYQIYEFEVTGLVTPESANFIIEKLGGEATVKLESRTESVWAYINALCLKKKLEVVTDG